MTGRTRFSLKTAPVAAAVAAAILGLPQPSWAEVSDAGPAGFAVRNVVTVKGPPAAAYARFLEIGKWWDAAHTYSQDSHNLSLKAVPGGCLCEGLKDGGFVEHLRVVLVMPGKRLTLQGGLGPLLEMGATGAMTVKFEAVESQTRVTMTYAVTVSVPGNREISAAVDGVLLEQLQRYQRVADAG